MWLHLMSLVPNQVAGAFGAQPLIMATLFDTAARQHFDRHALACVFDLSPARAQVACRLAEGDTPQQIAAACGVALSTVRTHLHAVLGRLAVKRSEELVRLLHDTRSRRVRHGRHP